MKIDLKIFMLLLILCKTETIKKNICELVDSINE